jgi:hypothetical protein
MTRKLLFMMLLVVGGGRRPAAGQDGPFTFGMVLVGRTTMAAGARPQRRREYVKAKLPEPRCCLKN